MGLLKLIYRDQHYVAINKPESLLVHRSRLSRDHVFALQLLRDQIGQFVYPVHRLDRPTSGVLVFGLSSEAASALCRVFEEHRIRKTYLAVVRGILPEKEKIDYALRGEDGEQVRDAITVYQRLAAIKLDDFIHERTRPDYSLAAVQPQTGRMHQIRRHFHHIHHPIIGDTTHGDGHHNRFFRERFNCYRLLLHAAKITFEHPFTGEMLSISASIPEEFRDLFEAFEWHGIKSKIDNLTDIHV